MPKTVTRYNLGVTLWAQSNLKEAELEYRESLRLDPNYIEEHNGLGNILIGIGKPKEAETEYREALRLQPNSAPTHYDLGLTLNSLDRPKEAEIELKEAIKCDPNYSNDGSFHFELASAFLIRLGTRRLRLNLERRSGFHQVTVVMRIIIIDWPRLLPTSSDMTKREPNTRRR